jgi:hypothetical protein
MFIATYSIGSFPILLASSVILIEFKNFSYKILSLDYNFSLIPALCIIIFLYFAAIYYFFIGNWWLL